MEETITKIRNVILNFEIKFGKKPNAIYLGRYEHRILQTWAELHSPGMIVRELEKFEGIDVHKISGKIKYIGVGLCTN